MRYFLKKKKKEEKNILSFIYTAKKNKNGGRHLIFLSDFSQLFNLDSIK